MTSAALQQRKADVLSRIARIRAEAAAEGRQPSESEMQTIRSMTSDLMLDAEVEKIGERHAMGAEGGSGFYEAVVAAGWNRTEHPSAVVPFLSAFSFDGDYSDAVPAFIQSPAFGADSRFLTPVFPRVDVAADETSVSSFRQKGRTLPSPLSDVIRDIDQTDAKAEVDTSTELANEPLHQIAVVETGVPNVVLDSASARSWISADLSYAYSAGVDAHVIAQIQAASPAMGDGGEDLLEAILRAAETVASNGYAPSVLAASPETLIDLTLLRQPEGGLYVFSGNAPPLDGIRKVAVTGLETSYVLDPTAAGTFYVSPVTLKSFEEEHGTTNASTVRVESNGVFLVQRVGAIAEVTVAS